MRSYVTRFQCAVEHREMQRRGLRQRSRSRCGRGSGRTIYISVWGFNLLPGLYRKRVVPARDIGKSEYFSLVL